MTDLFDVIIVGGGPVGAALGIELGLNNIKTLILEKHDQPLLSPRAQSLNERSMELCMRWGIVEKMRDAILFSDDYPMRGVWCSKLNGVTYATASSQDQLTKNTVAQKAIRLPLYITETILREKLTSFDSITFLKNEAVNSVEIENEFAIVKTDNKNYRAKYVVGCDGANSILRQSAEIPFKELAQKRRVINLVFQSDDLMQKITVKKGFLYYLLENKTLAAMGPVDIQQGIWYAQIFYPGEEKSINEVDVDQLIETITGIHFSKRIINKHFWTMQIQLANHYQKGHRLFLAGDAAHAFAPTGGFGLNTGLGDVTNLAWKLSAVIQKRATHKLLETYELERRPVALRNLAAAEKNAADAIAVRTQFPPDKIPEKFADENARVAKQHSHACGITLGYCYDPNEPPMLQSTYTPTCKPGYFLPNVMINEKSIYEKLSPTKWTLLVCGKEKIKFQLDQLKICHAPEGAYPSRYILIRPDWHIAFAGDVISEHEVKNVLENL